MRYLMFLQLFAHAHQERWSSLVDAKLRQSLVTRDNYIFNTNYEGNPKAGKVKIPVRDTEVTVKAYDKATGVDLEIGTTTYIDLDIDQDKVDQIIDFNGQKHQIKTIEPLYDNLKLHHYEIGMVRYGKN